VDPRIGLDTVEKRTIFHCWESNPGLPSRSLAKWSLSNYELKQHNAMKIIRLKEASRIAVAVESNLNGDNRKI
jgi:hypothetical protein